MSGRIVAGTLLAAVGFAMALGLAVGERPTVVAQETKEAPKRKPWTTSKITGSPEPPPKYKSVRVFPDVKFNHPLLIARCPGSERLFVGEQEGVIYSIVNKPDAKKELSFDLRKELKTIAKLPGAKGVGELYGLVFHPKFEENRYCYVCYTLTAKTPPKDGRFADGSRMSRFTVTKTEPPRIDPASEEIILTFVGGGHNGGDLHFGPDGMLYISTGDAANPSPPDPLNTGQDCSDLLSSILRIDVNRKDPGKKYAIPKDNPFVGMKDVRPEIWAYGFRNPWRMSFDRQSGDMWVGDVGWELWEMVHKVEKGGNYGWSITEGPQSIKPSQKIGPTPIRAPMIALPHTIAASVTGGYVYRGKKFPELEGAYIFGDWETRRIWAARFKDGRVSEMPEIVKPFVRPSAFGEDQAGELYFLDYDSGLMYTLERNDAAGANANFPKRLSETGLFKDVKTHEMEEGVVRYTPNAPQWMDGAWGIRFIALPNGSSVKLFDQPRKMPGQVFWHEFKMHFPKDAVLVKTIFQSAAVKQFIETQVLHFDGEDWHGYTYAWRPDQSDADLVPAEGSETEIELRDMMLTGDKHRQRWTFPSRTQCLTCHNAWSEYALSFTVPQLNIAAHAPHRFAGMDRPDDFVGGDLISFTGDGTIVRLDSNDKRLPAYTKESAAKEPRLHNPYLLSDKIAAQDHARSYLHVNCAHCHRFGGGGGQVVLELDYAKPNKDTGVIDARPKQGDFGIPDARLIAPGAVDRSVLLYRMAKFGAGRMPHLGSEWPDPMGMIHVQSWILSLANKRCPGLPFDEIETSIRKPQGALPFAISMQNDNELPANQRAKVLSAAAKLESGPVRDLFEGYLPPDPKGRKLGANPRPASILALKGDARSGEAIFFDKEMKCANCHKIGDRGTALGPDLTAIGKTRSREELLESLLQPSLRVEPQYAAYLVRTKDEKTATGLLVKRDDKQVTIRDAENKEHAFAAANVESVTPSRMSLMPDGQMSGLRAQQAADLLEFLMQRKGP